MSVKLYSEVKNSISRPTFDVKDVAGAVIFVDDFDDYGGLPAAFLANRVLQNRSKVRIYDADGVGFSESAYIDEDYVTVAVDRGINAGMDSILAPVPGGKGYLKWYEEEEGTQGYGVNHGQGHKITYTDEVEGSWSTPDLEYLGPFVALHRNTGTRQVWLMIHESAMNDITERDMTGVNEVGLRFVNTELCLGGYNQTAPDGAIWNCQGCTIREGSDPNATGADASYVNIEVAVEGHGIVPHALAI